jgi:hypothetical protein
MIVQSPLWRYPLRFFKQETDVSAYDFSVAPGNSGELGFAESQLSAEATFTCQGSVGTAGTYGSMGGTFGSVATAGSFGCSNCV